MQRQTNTSRSAHAIDLPHESPIKSPRSRRIEGNPSLPVCDNRSNDCKKAVSRSWLRDNLVHLIPVVVLLCLFILWWFSHPVNLERKNERIIVVEKEDAEHVNVTNVHVASLASAISTPHSLVPHVKILRNGSREEGAYSTE